MHFRRERTVLRGQAEIGSSLKHVEMGCLARDCGNRLDPGRAGTDHRYLSAR